MRTRDSPLVQRGFQRGRAPENDECAHCGHQHRLQRKHVGMGGHRRCAWTAAYRPASGVLRHRRITYVCRDPQSLLTLSAAQRIRGFKEACAQAHIKDDVLVIPDGDDSLQSTFNALINMQPMPTAICCQEDGIAIPLMCRLREFGLKIPGDISITGFDDGTTRRNWD